MTQPQENNIEETRLGKRTNYRQLVFEITERRRGFKNKVVPLSPFGGGIKGVLKDSKICLKKVICVKRLRQKCRKLFIWRVRASFEKCCQIQYKLSQQILQHR